MSKKSKETTLYLVPAYTNHDSMFGEGVTRFYTFSHLISNLVTPVPNDHERVLKFRDPNQVPRTTMSI